MTFDPSAQGLDEEAVTERVDDAIESNEVVLFMKGSAMMPQCGYSKRAIGILQQYRDDVETVDTLQNLDAFRAALDSHSGWETIPQAFVDGEFIGGSDIIAELDEQGELAAKLGVDPETVESDAATDAPF